MEEDTRRELLSWFDGKNYAVEILAPEPSKNSVNDSPTQSPISVDEDQSPVHLVTQDHDISYEFSQEDQDGNKTIFHPDGKNLLKSCSSLFYVFFCLL